MWTSPRHAFKQHWSLVWCEVLPDSHPSHIRLAEAPSFGQSISVRTTSNGAEDYRNLSREVLGLPVVSKGALVADAA